MSLPPLQLSASSSASSGPSASGGIGAGESFDIGGINFGYQPQTATASGSQTPPALSGSSGVGVTGSGGISGTTILIVLGVLALGAVLLLRK